MYHNYVLYSEREYTHAVQMPLAQIRTPKKVSVGALKKLKDRDPTYALVAGVDLVVTRFDDSVSVLYGRCLHRGALMSDGHVEGGNLVCGVHGWDYRLETGVSAYSNSEVLHRFQSWIDEAGNVLVDENEIATWAIDNPQPYNRDEYLGLYQDIHGTPDEDKNGYIQRLAREGLSKLGHHGATSAMGIARPELPSWDDLQILTAQLARLPLQESEHVDTSLTIGPAAKKPLRLEIPVFVSDMSYGALSEEAKTALAKGAELAGTGICSGEGGMLPEEQANNSRYFYELASGKFGWDVEKTKQVQAFHFKAGQGAKTGTGGHLPGHKVTEKIAEVRGLNVGEPAISPPTFPDLHGVADYKRIAEEVREVSSGIPIGFKLSAQHIEEDIDFALVVGVDYIILDGRGGATGAAPEIFKQNISVPTMVALARARRHLDLKKANDVTLIITGGLRTESDFVKAIALGADGVAIANSAIQAIGCLGMRACHTNNCPVGIATQQDHLRRRLEIDKSAARLHAYLQATVELMQILARACAHRSLSDFEIRDLTTWKQDTAELTGVRYGGVGSAS